MVIKSERLYIDDHLRQGYIGIKNGKIVCLSQGAPGFANKEIDAGNYLVLPGLVDSHVHIREPGNSHRETFFTGTLAAANGGVTTIIEHPIASPPPYNLSILENRFRAAQGEIVVDVAFMGAAGEHNLKGIESFAKSGQIVGFKTFLQESPAGREMEFQGLTMCNDGILYEGIRTLAKTNLIWTLHAENNDMIQQNIKEFIQNRDFAWINHARSRPALTETETVAKVLLLSEGTGLSVLFCHISNPGAMELIKREKQKGRCVYVETCPHYLCFTEELIKEHGPFAKCNPPLRTEKERQGLWSYIKDGTVDIIGSDHAPYAVEEKETDNIFTACAGIPSLEVRFPLLFTKIQEGALSLQRFVELVSTNPAKLFGLYPRKGKIALGADADIILVNADKSYCLTTETMQTKSRKSAKAFENVKVTGEVAATIVRGEFVKENGLVKPERKGYGQILRPYKP
ncbi:MAG: allantoinase AllB [Acidaminococcales bacterium]|nr:allantoinase AllB [Acidaminococcales bacterium]